MVILRGFLRLYKVAWGKAEEVHFGSKGERKGGRKGLEEATKVETRLLGVNRNSYWLAWGNPTY